MKFLNINICNFRQYYGSVNIDLGTSPEKNIIVIGGMNGYGKTNLLLSIVWCLYGDKISLIDDNFKKAIQKEKGYSSFMKQSLNWTAEKENKNNFSVEIIVSEAEFPEINTIAPNPNSVHIKRSFDVSSMQEVLSISDPTDSKEIFEDENDKINFINDFIIPLDAAKFVFFDAEKIAEIADLSIKEEGSFINDALGKILGLDIYETLIEDLENYINNLKREGATKNLQEQMADIENTIRISNIEIDGLEEDKAEKLKKIDDLRKEIREYNNLISHNSKHGNTQLDRETISSQINVLKDKERELNDRFNELCEIIPLAILTGKLEEVNEHLEIQTKTETDHLSAKENIVKIENFIELLFNKAPEPPDSSMSLKDKMFYYNKAQSLGAELFKEDQEILELDFEHDLSNSEKQIIIDTINLINTQSKVLFETTIEEFNEVRIQLDEMNNNLRKVDADMEDDIISEYSSKRESAEREISSSNRDIGIYDEKTAKLQKDISRLNQQYQSLLKKVEINQQNKTKISKSNEYLSTLKDFVLEQKEKKKESLAKSILEEMQILMHKLKKEEDENKFVDDVVVTILADGNGMKITLYDSDDEEIKKEVLSKGEKQIYISCLIKAILKESVQSLPIFIDTPLGRLDDEHIKNTLIHYYPNLSEQIVILSTNNEITPKRFRDISANVSKSYLLVNDGANTILKNGYF